MRCGAARVSITPDTDSRLWSEGIHLTGYVARSGPASGVLDSIHARTAIFESGGQKIVLISLDVLDLTVEHATALRTRVANMLGTGVASVCICCSHTHYAPAVLQLSECGRPSAAYVTWMNERIIESVRLALGGMEDVRLEVGQAPLDIGRNRRAPVRGDRGGADGSSPRDQKVRVLVAKRSDERVKAVVFHYACHMVSLRSEFNQISADLCGVAAQMVENQDGASDGADGPVALFVNGCAGDINPQERYSVAVEKMQAGGRIMGEAVLTAMQASKPLADQEMIEAHACGVDLPTDGPDPAWSAQLEKVRAALSKPDLDAHSVQARQLKAHQRFLSDRLDEQREGRYPASVASRLVCLRVGALRMLVLSDEVFYELGQQIIAGRDARLTWPIAYGNGGRGYVCTRAAHAEGGYEPTDSNWYYNRAPLSPASGEALVRAGRNCLR